MIAPARGTGDADEVSFLNPPVAINDLSAAREGPNVENSAFKGMVCADGDIFILVSVPFVAG